MKFTRSPDAPEAQPAKSRKLPPLKPITLARKPEDNRILDEDGETVTTILYAGGSDYEEEQRYTMKVTLIAAVVCGVLLWILNLIPTQGDGLGAGMLIMLAGLFLYFFTAGFFLMFLKSGFLFLIERARRR